MIFAGKADQTDEAAEFPCRDCTFEYKYAAFNGFREVFTDTESCKNTGYGTLYTVKSRNVNQFAMIFFVAKKSNSR